MYFIVPELRRVDFPYNFQLITFIFQPMVFMADVLWKSLPENFSWRKSSDLFRRFFVSTSTHRLSFLHLNFTVTDSFFFKWWQACKSSGLASCSIKESALQMFNLSSSSLIDEGTGFTSTDSGRWYLALVTAFLSNWTTLSVSNLMQFLVIAKSDDRTSNLKNSSIDLKSQRVLKICHRQWWVLLLKGFPIDFLFEPFLVNLMVDVC